MTEDRSATVHADIQQLHELGYAQELNRGMGWFSNFAISFSIISILAGGLTSYWLGMVTGGPRVITLGWIIVGFFALLVGMAMGEICSAYPTAGGLYYWSAKLAGETATAPRWAWFTGWFNLLGQIGVIASVDYALAVFIAYFIRMFDDGFNLTVGTIFVIYLLVLISHGLLNTFGVQVVRLLSDISVWWHVVGVAIFFLVLVVAPDNTRGLDSVFDQAPDLLVRSHGLDRRSVHLRLPVRDRPAARAVHDHRLRRLGPRERGDGRRPYRGAQGHRSGDLRVGHRRLLPQRGDDPGAPEGNGPIDATYAASRSAGPTTRSSSNAAPRLIDSALGDAAAKLLIFIAIVAQYFCGMASVTANSRMIYAFSRDGALPGSAFWHRINPRTRTPTNSVWLGVTLSAIVGSTSLYVRGRRRRSTRRRSSP